jgi:putative transposase
MARPLRIEREDTCYHVINRGNARAWIFHEPADYQGFLDRLGRCAERFEIDVLAYVLMGNHYHLLLRTRRASLSAAMQWLGVAYGSWHNARHRRSGHVFQGRFKSFLVHEQEYVYRLFLYMHRNPLRAKAVERLAEYPWSSYAALAYGRGGPAWFDPAGTHRFLDTDARAFRRAVARYDERRDDLFSNLYYGLMLGSAEAVESLRRQFADSPDPEKPQVHQLRSHGGIEACIAPWCRILGISDAACRALRRPARHVARPERDVLIYLLWRDGRFRLAQIGEYFGIGYPAVSLAKTRAETLLQKDKPLRRRLNITI